MQSRLELCLAKCNSSGTVFPMHTYRNGRNAGETDTNLKRCSPKNVRNTPEGIACSQMPIVTYLLAPSTQDEETASID